METIDVAKVGASGDGKAPPVSGLGGRGRSGRVSKGEHGSSRPSVTSGRLLTSMELAVFLSIPVATVRQWRYTGSGPKAFKVGRHLRYDPAEVSRWLVEECGRPEDGSA